MGYLIFSSQARGPSAMYRSLFNTIACFVNNLQEHHHSFVSLANLKRSNKIPIVVLLDRPLSGRASTSLEFEWTISSFDITKKSYETSSTREDKL